MQHREHDDRLIRCPKVNGIGERVQQRSANFAGHYEELKWPLADARERPIDIAEKPLGEYRSLLVVPRRGSRSASASGRTMNRRAISVQWLSSFLRRRS